MDEGMVAGWLWEAEVLSLFKADGVLTESVLNTRLKCLHLTSGPSREGNGNPLQYSCLENPWMEEPGRLQSMGS